MSQFAHTISAAALFAALCLQPPAIAAAQTPAASILGSVRDAETGEPVRSAHVTVGQRRTGSDSLGHFALTEMPLGEARISISYFGFLELDTTVVLATSGQTHLDVRLEPEVRQSKIRAVEQQNIAAGRTDSSALGLLHRTPLDSSLTFGTFGARFVNAAAHQRGVDSNTVLSPMSAAFALSMPLLGASDATAREIAGALGVSELDPATLRRRTAAAMSAGNGRQDVELKIANAIWVDTSVRLVPSFADAVASYRASVRSLALSAPASVGAINAWADSATNGKISQVLNAKLPDHTRLFIANAVYFKGKWLDQFEKSETRRRDFRLPSGAVVQIDGMERTGYVGYHRGDHYQMMRLPYRGGRFAMYVVLPDSGSAATAVDEEFAQHGSPASLVQQDFRHVHLVIPRLHLKATYDLQPALESVGIRRAFDCFGDEFPGIAVQRDGGRSAALCIGGVAQAIYLDVDEEGTEAAAVTGIMMIEVTSSPPPPIQFIVDRPFLILLRDEQTGANLFSGVIARP